MAQLFKKCGLHLTVLAIGAASVYAAAPMAEGMDSITPLRHRASLLGEARR